MGTHPIFESDFDCLTEQVGKLRKWLLTVKTEKKISPKVNRNTKSPSPRRTAPPLSEFQTNWSKLPRTSHSKSRDQSASETVRQITQLSIDPGMDVEVTIC